MCAIVIYQYIHAFRNVGSDSVFGGILTVVSFFYNHGEVRMC